MLFKLLDNEVLYQILWNQYLLEDSTLYRMKHIKFKYKSHYYLHLLIKILKFLGKDLIGFSSLLSFLIGYLFYKKVEINKKDIFLFTRLFELNNIPNKFQTIKVNLFPFIKINEISWHMYSLLNLQEILKTTIISFIKFPNTYLKIFLNCRRDKIPFFKYIVLNKLCLTTVLELNLLYLCLTKIDKESNIANSEHFTPYMHLLSVYRLSNRKNSWSLHLYQHGVYELDKFQRAYNKVYADKMFYKFKQSLAWIKENYILNTNCSFNFIESKQISKSYLKKKKKLIAYASSGFYIQDNFILKKLNTLQKENKNIEILFYPHPQLNLRESKNMLKKYNRCKLIIRERFLNIDLLITGYSSLGLDYLNLNVKVLFVPFEDKICAFNDDSLCVVKDFNSFDKRLKEILC